MCFVNSTWSAKKDPMQKCAKNAKKYRKNIEKVFLTHFAHSAFYTIHISEAANRHVPVQYAKYVFFLFSKQSSWYEPFTSFVSFSQRIIIIYWLILTVNHQGSYFPFFFIFIQWVKHFCTPANFVSTVLNNKNIFIYNLCFGLSKLYTNIQQDQKAKLDYHMSIVLAYMAGGEGVGFKGFNMFCQRGVWIFSTCFVCVCGGGGGVSVPLLPWKT